MISVAVAASSAAAAKRKRDYKVKRQRGVPLLRFEDGDDSSSDEAEIWAQVDDEGFDPNVKLPLWPQTKNNFYWLYLLLSEPLSSKASQWTSVLILTAIMFSVVLFIIETLPSFSSAEKPLFIEISSTLMPLSSSTSMPLAASSAQKNNASVRRFFELSDVVCMCIFTAEYFLRLLGASGTPRHVLDPRLPVEAVAADLQTSDTQSANAQKPKHKAKEKDIQLQISQMLTAKKVPKQAVVSNLTVTDTSKDDAPSLLHFRRFVDFELERTIDRTSAESRRCICCRKWLLQWCLCCGCVRHGCGEVCCRVCFAQTCDNLCLRCNLCSIAWCKRWFAASQLDNAMFWKHIGSRLTRAWLFFKAPLNLVDVAVLVPFLVKVVLWLSGSGRLLHGGDDSGDNSMVALRTFRLARVFRVMKLSKHTKAVNLFFKVLRRSSGPMSLLMFFLGLCVVVFGSIAYNAEMGEWNTALQCYARDNTLIGVKECSPFEDMLISFYWVLVTITTVGYGDMVCMSAIGRVVAVILMLVGVIGFAMPITVISTTFQEEYELLKSRSREEFRGLMKVAEWDVNAVCVWLASVSGDLKKYVPAFRREQITGDILDTLTDAHLIELGFEKIADRQRFKKALKSLFGQRQVQTDPIACIQRDLAAVHNELGHVIKMVKVTQKYVHKIDKFQKRPTTTPSFAEEMEAKAKAFFGENSAVDLLDDGFGVGHQRTRSSARFEESAPRKSTRTHQALAGTQWLNRDMKELSAVPSVWQLSAWKQHTV